MIGLPELALLALAGYRGTQLAVYDTVLDRPRNLIIDWHLRRADQNRGTALSSALVTLISCIYCMGWWVSGAFLAAYLLAAHQWHGVPLISHGIEWFAVAGGQALLSLWDNSRKKDDA
jgi:hypothetical protein